MGIAPLPLMIALLAAMALAGCHSKTDTPIAIRPPSTSST